MPAASGTPNPKTHKQPFHTSKQSMMSGLLSTFCRGFETVGPIIGHPLHPITHEEHRHNLHTPRHCPTCPWPPEPPRKPPGPTWNHGAMHHGATTTRHSCHHPYHFADATATDVLHVQLHAKCIGHMQHVLLHVRCTVLPPRPWNCC